MHGIADVYLVYFDASNLSEEAEAAHAARVADIFADMPVRIDLKDQARVHLSYEGRFGYAIEPYRSAAQAIATFPTNSPAIGVRPGADGLDMIAPFGLADLLAPIVRPNRAQITQAIYEAKLALVVMASGLRRKPQGGDQEEQNLLADYLPLLRNRRLMVVTGALSLEVFATAIADVAFVFLIMVTLGSGPTAFGVLTALWAGGMLIGAALAERVIGHRVGLAAFGTAMIMGATMLLIGLAIVAIAFIAGGGANSIHNVAVRTLLQSECPPADHGKVAAIYDAVTRTAAIGGYVAGGFFVPDDAPTAYLVDGLLGVGAGLAGWRIFNRRWRTHNAGKSCASRCRIYSEYILGRDGVWYKFRVGRKGRGTPYALGSAQAPSHRGNAAGLVTNLPILVAISRSGKNALSVRPSRLNHCPIRLAFLESQL